MGIRGIKEAFDSLWKDINVYLNTFGKFYIKYQFFMRILFMELLLSDVFTGDFNSLICDTNQVACEKMCINRFNTITFQKLWETEFYISTLVTMVFVIFEMSQRRFLKRIKSKIDKGYSKELYNDGLTSSMTRGRSVTATRTRKDGEEVEVQIVFSSYISTGYILMLIARLFVELWFLKIEYNLGVHQTGKTGIYAWSYDEKYNCSTNYILDTADEITNAKSMFYIGEPLEACNQNEYVVPCWIPNSILKTKGLYFMVIVLLGGILLTALELLTALIDACSKTSKTYIDKIIDDADEKSDEKLYPPAGTEISTISPAEERLADSEAEKVPLRETYAIGDKLS